jgi:hypothetical protein
MEFTTVTRPGGNRPVRPSYYEKLGWPTDAILRCDACKGLVLIPALKAAHGCPTCGTSRFVEVRALSLWEWVKIRLGILDFPRRREFLREFGRG